MRVTATANIRFGTTVAEIKEVLTHIPDHANVSVRAYTGDRPGESSYSTMTFSWDLSV